MTAAVLAALGLGGVLLAVSVVLTVRDCERRARRFTDLTDTQEVTDA